MYNDLLKSLNLNNSEIEIYSILLEHGELPVKQIMSHTELTRTNIYNVLTSLCEKKLIEEVKNKKRTFFRPAHPNQLQELLEDKEKFLSQAKINLESNLPAIISDYNLAIGKPGVRFYEGREAVREIAEDSLKAKEKILSYVDVEAVQKYAKKENEAYIKKREKLNKKKQIIVPKSEFNKKYFDNLGDQVTDVRFIDHDLGKFNTVMMIYDNKTSYLTLTKKAIIGIIIDDQMIAKMHKGLFEFNWVNSKSKGLLI